MTTEKTHGDKVSLLGTTHFVGSPIWTRTRNPSINSRMLCQLSYGGSTIEDYQVTERELHAEGVSQFSQCDISAPRR